MEIHVKIESVKIESCETLSPNKKGEQLSGKSTLTLALSGVAKLCYYLFVMGILVRAIQQVDGAVFLAQQGHSLSLNTGETLATQDLNLEGSGFGKSNVRARYSRCRCFRKTKRWVKKRKWSNVQKKLPTKGSQAPFSRTFYTKNIS